MVKVNGSPDPTLHPGSKPWVAEQDKASSWLELRAIFYRHQEEIKKYGVC